ncbi:MAG: EAL domain-containing protein [Saccharofermentans sp.]|nr:EAL domain-containing protein [Saccharofermentans sp.]
MHRRLRFALLAGQIDESGQSRFVSGFLKQAFSDDIDVCIFSMYRKYQSTHTREQAEMNIFNLFTPTSFDGIVILKDTLQTSTSSNNIENRINEIYQGPVLVINRESEFFDSVFIDDYSGMCMLVSHMIEEHGYKDIAYISGRKGHIHSNNRLQAFKDTMTAHGLTVCEERIHYGDYWYSSGEAAVKEMASSQFKLPEAIVCANDEMAIGAAAALTDMGLKIPEDIAVAGFDTSSEGRLSPQSLTSCDFLYEETGAYAAMYVRDIINGHNPGHFNTKPVFVPGETCGCGKQDLSRFSPTRKNWTTDRMSESFDDVYNMLGKDLVMPSNMEEFFSTVYSYAYQIKGAENISLCLCSTWKDLEDLATLKVKNNGYPSKMIRAMRYNSLINDGTVDLDDVFNTRYMIPELGEDRQHPTAFCFTPFYCEDLCFGYSVVSYGDKPVSYDENYRKWMEVISTGFELLRRNIAMTSFKNFIDNTKGNKFATTLNQYDTLTEEEKKECALVEKILDDNLLTYHFQPIVDSSTGEIFSYEALMRTTTEEFVSPLTIIKYAGFLGRMHDIEYLTFFNTLSLLDQKGSELKDAKLFINSIPGVHLNPEQNAKIDELLRRHADNIVVEITEEAELDDTDLQKNKNRLSKYGIEIAIDDFGTGYSNINNLLRYMPNYVKIDRSLLSGIDKAPQKQHFVQEIINFCKDNDILALAEGIETSEEMSTVIHMGADLIQGYYTAKPAPSPIPRIGKTIRNEIAIYSQEKEDGSQKQVYEAGSSNRVSLSLLAQYGCTDIIVGKEDSVYRDITIVGAPNLRTDMHVKVLAGYTGEITLENTYFSNIKSRPCIEIEEGSSVTLVINGNNTLNGIGICVAPGASLITKGEGNMTIICSDAHYYGIGNTYDSRHGDLIFNHNGTLFIDSKGSEGVGIGSGLGGSIEIRSGQYNIKAAGTRSIGIGAITAEGKVSVINCNLEMDFNSNVGTGIGSLDGPADVYITRSSVNILGSGNFLTGIGSTGDKLSVVNIYDASAQISIRSNESTCIGSLEGSTQLRSTNAGLNLDNAGNHALAVGGVKCETSITLKSTDTRVKIHNGLGRDTYAEDDNISIVNGRVKFIVNDQDIIREPIVTDWN